MDAKAYRPLVALAAAVAISTIVIGGYVSSTESGMGCGDDWPHCNGTLSPELTHQAVLIEWTHRLAAIALGAVGLAVLAYTVSRRALIPRASRTGVYLAAGLFATQALLGALVVKTHLTPELVAAHAGVASALFASLVVAFVLAPRSDVPAEARQAEADDEHSSTRSRPVTKGVQDRVSPYLEMVKPGILFLLLIVGAAAILIAPGSITLAVAGATLLGGGLAACSAAVLNNVIERKKDAQMARTKKRALASGRVPVAHAWVFAGVLAVLSMTILGVFVNLLSAAFALAGLLFYVIVYTMWLKPNTPQNVVIGGAAGCMPALVGWAAVTNDVSLAPVILGLLVFLWTPPHFWALALVYKEDYAKAAFPMLPNVKGEESTKRQVLFYSALTVVASLLLVWPLGVLGWLYAGSAIALGGVFVYLAWATLRATPAAKPAYRLFGFSIVYLGALYAAMIADRALLGHISL